MPTKPLIVVAGALANKPLNGGEAWVRMSWVRGLQRLGWRVWFVEQIDEQVCTDESGHASSFADSVNRRWFGSVTERFGLTGTSSLICDGGVTDGTLRTRLRDIMSEAELLVNISGNLTDPVLRNACGRRAYIDLDPGFTQMWHDHRGRRLIPWPLAQGEGSRRSPLGVGPSDRLSGIADGSGSRFTSFASTSLCRR
jgi:hypothetical protein